MQKTLNEHFDEMRNKTNQFRHDKVPTPINTWINWYIQTLKHPLSMIHTPKNAGIISVISMYFIFIISATSTIYNDQLKKVVDILVPAFKDGNGNNQSNIISQMYSSPNFTTVVHTVSKSWHLFIYGMPIITLCLLYGMIHLFRTNTDWDEQIVNAYAQRMSWVIPISIFMYLLRLIGLPNMGIYVIGICVIINISAFITTLKIYEYEYKTHFMTVAIVSTVILILGIFGLTNPCQYLQTSVLQTAANEISSGNLSVNDVPWANFVVAK